MEVCHVLRLRTAALVLAHWLHGHPAARQEWPIGLRIRETGTAAGAAGRAYSTDAPAPTAGLRFIHLTPIRIRLPMARPQEAAEVLWLLRAISRLLFNDPPSWLPEFRAVVENGPHPNDP